MKKNIAFDEKNVVLSFGVLSDIHIESGRDDDWSAYRYRKSVETAYRLSRARRPDLFFYPGDLTQNTCYDPQSLHEIGDFKALTDRYLDPETALVFCTGNHDGNLHRSYEKEFTDVFTATAEDVARYYKYDVDMESVYSFSGNRHAVVGGYHFLSVGIYKDYIAYLKPILDELTAKDPLRPIFVAYHFPAADTVYATHYAGSGNDTYDNVAFYEDRSGFWDLRRLLDNYPQVILFAGHTHCALENPRAIWQGTFTAIDTASVQGLDDNSFINFSRKIPVNAKHAEMFGAFEGLLAEVDASSNVRLTCYNASRGDVVAVYTIPAPKADRSHLTVYANDRRDRSPAATFPVRDLQMEKTEAGDIHVTFTQAEHPDIVWYYTLRFFDGDRLVQAFDLTSRYFATDGMPKHIDAVILKDENMPESDNHKSLGAHRLEDGKQYRAELCAYDAWDQAGETQTCTYTA